MKSSYLFNSWLSVPCSIQLKHATPINKTATKRQKEAIQERGWIALYRKCMSVDVCVLFPEAIQIKFRKKKYQISLLFFNSPSSWNEPNENYRIPTIHSIDPDKFDTRERFQFYWMESFFCAVSSLHCVVPSTVFVWVIWCYVIWRVGIGIN